MMKKLIVLFYLSGSACLTSLAQDMGVGILTPSGKLHLKGASNISQLMIDANSTQSNTNPLIRLRNSNGSDLLWIHSDDTSSVFIGVNAGRVNNYQGLVDGSKNIFIGGNAGYSNTSGSSNIAIGHGVMYSNTGGYRNAAVGHNSLYFNLYGDENTAFGESALYTNGGGSNIGFGSNALRFTNTGSYNVAVGYKSGFAYSNAHYNVFIGAEADATISNGVYMVAIGNIASCTASDQIRIGNSFTVSIGGYADWTNISDGRFKKNITEEVKGLEFISKLQPVTYNLDVQALSNYLNEGRGHEMNEDMIKEMARKEQIVQSGFIAQEVESAAKCIGFSFSGIDVPKNENDLYALRYAQFVVPLVKAVQELQAEIEILSEENSRLNQLEQEITDLKKNIESRVSEKMAVISDSKIYLEKLK